MINTPESPVGFKLCMSPFVLIKNEAEFRSKSENLMVTLLGCHACILNIYLGLKI